MKRLLMLLAVCLDFVHVSAQINTSQINTYSIAPPPNAAALARYGEIPVSLYSGIPSIEIPMFTAQSGQLQFPVSLTYHAGGIRVGEVASRAGLGWSLNAGGCITRTIMGLPDEQGNGFNSIKDRGGLKQGYGVTDYADSYLMRLGSGLEDTESDVYYYNYNQRSGKFMFFDSAYRTLPYSKLHIGDLDNFKKYIVDENGFRYEFRDAESSSTSSNVSESFINAPQAWYLSRIFSPDKKDSIILTYEDFSYSVSTRQEQETKKILYDFTTGDYPATVDEKTESSQMISGSLLKSVTGTGFQVKFYYSARTDATDKKIDSIVYLDGKGNRMKKFLLNYSYFSGAEKLRLDSVIEYGSGTQSLPAYKFSYLNPNSVPRLTSLSQDHWGFYNGKQNNTLIPYIVNRLGREEKLADRETDTTYLLNGILNKIDYPTGGYSTFEYQGNDYGWIKNGEAAPEYYEKSMSAGARLRYNTLGVPGAKSDTFQIQQKQEVSISYYITNCNDNVPCTSYNNLPSEGVVALYRIQGTQKILILHYYATELDRSTEGQVFKTLDPGTYSIDVNVVNPYDYLRGMVGYKLFTDSVITRKRLTGGARVAKITSYDGISHSNDVIKRYEYTMADKSYSSGVIMGLPQYHYSYTQLGDDGHSAMCGKRYTYNCYTSFSQMAPGSSQGGVVGYRRVTELLNTKDSTIRTVSYFTSAYNYPDWTIQAPPFPPAISFDWRRGLLTHKLTYGAGNELLLWEKKKYAIMPDFSYSVQNFKVQQRSFCVGSAIVNGKYMETQYNTEYFSHKTDWMPLISDSVITYSRGMRDSLLTVTAYTYDTTSLNPGVVTRTSSQKTITERFRYPLNYKATATDNISAGIRNLQQLHILAPVIESWTSYSTGADSGVTAGRFVSFKTDRPYPETVYKLMLNTPVNNFTPSAVAGGAVTKDSRYEPVIVFDLYDNLGNVLQQHKANDMTESFIWAYGNRYPVAAVKGMTYAVADGIVNAGIVSSSYDDTEIRNRLAALRNTAGVLVNTYTFRPLLGMTSATDPSGQTIYYEYDGFGRLSLVRDTKGKILKMISYNYQAPAAQ
ncbi:RHS repeat domain-containing protein [Chitinophaga solisilvae]|uniref:RHS repeat domain-containing protein n=1 Tax=Chitinophaga solisilvae TaxID=1233460 RepID=UPI0013682114|nr:RHS repeat domain-containing protein [Chitinophaga solisilvae]